MTHANLIINRGLIDNNVIICENFKKLASDLYTVELK